MKLIVITSYAISVFSNFQENIIVKIPRLSIYIFHNKLINKLAIYRQIFRIFINDKIKP